MCFRNCTSHSEVAASLNMALLNQTATQLLMLTSKKNFQFPFTLCDINLPLNLGLKSAI